MEAKKQNKISRNSTYRKFFITMFCLALISAAFYMIPPLLIQLWQNSAEGFSETRLIILGCVLVLSVVLSIVTTIFRESFAENYNIANFDRLSRHFYAMDYDSMQEMGVMSALDKIAQSVNRTYTFMTGSFIQMWAGFIIIALCLIFFALQNIYLAVVLALAIPLNYFGYKLINKELYKRSKVMQETTATGFQKLLSQYQEVDYLKQSPSIEPSFQSLEGVKREIYGSMAKVNKFAQSSSMAISGINSTIQSLVYIIVIYSSLKDNMGLSSLLIFSLLLPVYFSNVSVITNSNLNKQDYQVALDFEEELQSKREHSGAEKIDSIEQMSLDIKEVPIGKGSMPITIQDSWQKGDIVWIKGPSGSGKSSVLKALAKFRPLEGVEINSKALNDLDNAQYRNLIEYLPQTPAIIDGSLRENLFFNHTYSASVEQELREDPLLRSIFANKNMDSHITAEGNNLSGGEKQKIAVLRALKLTNPDLLILDEVTSSLDYDSKIEILERIKSEASQRITVLVSHDEESAAIANKVIAL